jgi:hypothetical protein
MSIARRQDRRQDARSSERGAILVHVGAALAGLTAFSVLVVDLGAVWVARRQAQNAADASALSAAVTLAYGNPTDTAAAAASAAAIAGAHTVWGEPVTLGGDQVSFLPCPPGLDPLPAQCIRVDVNNGGAPLPVYFAALVGAGATTVTATATATVVAANSTNCLSPFAIVDRWTDNRDIDAPIDVGTWTPEDRYEAYLPTLPITPLLPPRDIYTAPTESDPGTGFAISRDVGYRVEVDLVDPDTIDGSRGNWFVSLDLTRDAGSTIPEDRYQENIESCRNVPFVIGDTVDPELYTAAATAAGVDALIARDPGAYWDGTQIAGSAFTVSPRVVALALLDPDFIARVIVERPPTAPPLPVVNVVGLFIESFEGTQLTGVMVPMSGNYDTSRPRLTEDSAFLRAITLVR